MILVASSGETLFVVFLDLLHLAVIEASPRRSPIIHQTDGNAVFYGVGHSVLIDHGTENVHRGIHRRSGKADVRRLRQRSMQKLGKAVALQNFVRLQHQLHVQIIARSVRLVGNTDNILSGAELSELVGKLLDRRKVHAAAGRLGQNVLQLLPAVHLHNGLVPDESPGIQKLPGKLIVQIGAIGDQQYCRGVQARLVHDEPGQKQHDKALAAASRAEVRATFAVSEGFLMGQDIRKQFPRREILRIAGHDLHVFTVVRIREIDEIVDDVIEPVFPEHALHHRIQCIYAVCRSVRRLNTPPGIKVLIVSEDASGLGIHAVGEHRKTVVLE